MGRQAEDDAGTEGTADESGVIQAKTIKKISQPLPIALVAR
jgi:hypothetical protein